MCKERQRVEVQVCAMVLKRQMLQVHSDAGFELLVTRPKVEIGCTLGFLLNYAALVVG